MNLYIFPQAASLTDGYGIGVEYAYNKLKPSSDDIIVWYTNRPKEKILHYKDTDYIIPRFPMKSTRSVINILRGRVRSEVDVRMLSFLRQYKFDFIHCDEVIFYRALKEMFPDTPMDVRFHNCFSRIYFRNKVIQKDLDLQYRITLRCELNTERLIFNDRTVRKIFISDEDRDFYTSMCGVYSDSEVWPYVPDMQKAYANRIETRNCRNLVWFGGINSHKACSVKWFCDDVFPKIKQIIPDVQLHLYGSGTTLYNNPSVDIFGHGFYNGTDIVPMRNALYINPDVIGGGIKLKLQTYIEAGVPFISSYFGFEGYNKQLIDKDYCIVEEDDKWVERIAEYIKDHDYDNQ